LWWLKTVVFCIVCKYSDFDDKFQAYATMSYFAFYGVMKQKSCVLTWLTGFVDIIIVCCQERIEVQDAAVNSSLLLNIDK